MYKYHPIHTSSWRWQPWIYQNDQNNKTKNKSTNITKEIQSVSIKDHMLSLYKLISVLVLVFIRVYNSALHFLLWIHLVYVIRCVCVCVIRSVVYRRESITSKQTFRDKRDFQINNKSKTQHFTICKCATKNKNYCRPFTVLKSEF